MIIELYGLPGSGKTTLARELAEEENFKIIKIKKRRELIYLNFVFFIKHPIKFFFLFYYITANSINHKIFYYKFMNAFLHCNAKYEKAKKGKGFLIIDQGYFQNIISIFDKKIFPPEIVKYLKFIVKPDWLIIFKISDEEREKRIIARGWQAGREFGDDYLAERKKISESNNKTFEEMLTGLNCRYFFYKDTDTADAVIEKIKRT